MVVHFKSKMLQCYMRNDLNWISPYGLVFSDLLVLSQGPHPLFMRAGGGVVGVAHIFQLILVAFLSSLILFTPVLFLAQTNIRKRQNSFSDQISVCLSVYVTVCCEWEGEREWSLLCICIVVSLLILTIQTSFIDLIGLTNKLSIWSHFTKSGRLKLFGFSSSFRMIPQLKKVS